MIQVNDEHRLGVPENISIVGVDDIEVSAFHNLPLTTIRQSFADFGIKAVSILLELINGRQESQRQVYIEPKLIARQSTTSLN